MLKILSIGNSFSDDGQAYVPQIFQAGGVQALFGNLFIGGCSLERHYNNMLSGEAAYDYRRNNVTMGKASLLTGLMDEEWDYITLQQASHFSGMWETYEPYLLPLAQYVREKCPKAQLVIHQTWAYEVDSTHGQYGNYDHDQQKMYAALKDCYDRAAKLLGAQVIRCGEAVQLARGMKEFDYAHGGPSLNRDGFHLGMVNGRYLAGAVWYEFFTGRSILDNPYEPCLMEYVGHEGEKPLYRPLESSRLPQEQLAALRQAAHQVGANN